ncbi:MAG TPA: sulfite exporter TauE/SafE family protein [Acidimicrobiia bacterium]|nr:sulfite exporter TauE/SafE family protein [Acidimicrobiia bacterium]
MQQLITFGLAGLIAQLVDGSLGMGYGVTSTSLLVTTGTAAAVASASVHVAKLGTAVAGGAAHHRFGNVDWRAVRWLAAPGALGAFLGAVALSAAPVAGVGPFVALFLLGLGVYVIVRFRAGASVGEVVARRPHQGRFFVVLGGGAGFLDAAGGGGWGPVGTSTLLAAGRMEPRQVIGTVSASEFLVSLGATAGFLIALPFANLNFALIGALLAGGLVAAPVAAWLTHHLDQRTLGTAIGVFIIATNLRTLAGALGADATTMAAASVVLAGVWLMMALHLARAVKRGLRARPIRETVSV